MPLKKCACLSRKSLAKTPRTGGRFEDRELLSWAGRNMTETRLSKTVFHSHRLDGMGARLRALINAITLANICDADFTFSWFSNLAIVDKKDAKYHAIGEAADIFDKDFLKNHCRNLGQEVLKKGYTRKIRSLEDIETAIKEDVEQISVDFMNVYAALSDARERIPKQEFKAAFDRIGFSEPVTEAIQIANSIDVPENAVALHMRAGDLVYGQYRIYENFTIKVVPVTAILEIVRHYQASGRSVYVFGEDLDACEFVASTEGAKSVPSISQEYNFNKYQQALFEIVFMSRFSEIFGGSSAFSMMAATISEAEFRTPNYLLGKEVISQLVEKYRATLESESILSGQQRAFSYWYTLKMSEDLLSAEQKLDYVSCAISLDPGNYLYRIVRACYLAESNDPEAAERELQTIWHEALHESFDKKTGPLAVLVARSAQGPALAMHRVETLFRLADPRRPYAALCASILPVLPKQGFNSARVKSIAIERAQQDDLLARALKKVGVGQ